ncbi:hypothetical protein G5T42_04075 [Microbacterium sp. 4R-513]|uniref:hypothetical protein n=1 Tax=Microbacterium sp. 4R-513 TaxID=2567934 RepID=UPI0013E10F8D|nr:hypothetical protein [Microbacterium sp. 4R-513]QIG38766.1 hypothetical protein G5T42_04075 [Microbacterium sp. 4R-513]
MSPRSVLAGVGALALAGLLLTGCATTSGGAATPAPTKSSSPTVEADPDLGAAWLDNGRMIGLVTLGSSTCVPVADEPKLDDDGVLQVTLVAPEAAKPCTTDLVPRVTLVGVPSDVDPADDLQIQVSGDDYYGEVELVGVKGLKPGGETDYNPSAGWATTAGQFVILTWGSSGCVPVIQDVAATGPAQVTVTYQTPPANQMCTMDMAPRAQVASVNDLKESSNVELVLTGDQYDNVKVPIYGTNAS